MNLRPVLLAARSAAVVLMVCAPLTAVAASDLVTTAVYAWADADYRREIQSNGRPAREYYAISNGGAMPGTVRDRAIEAVKFPEVAGALAQHLGRQNYFLATDASAASLLLVVHWGTTAPAADTNERLAIDRIASAIGQANVASPPGRLGGALPSTQAGIGPPGGTYNPEDVASLVLEMEMFQRMRQESLLPTAEMLGYLRPLNESNDIRRHFLDSTYNELMSEISDPRYYFIISAYDFRQAVEQNGRKLLWQTRISIRSRGLRFSDHFGDMLASGSRLFGKDNKRQLVRRQLREVRVDIGEATVVEMAPPSDR